jgi:16S rRNA (cytosine967-C5)-methyltransferase
MTPDPSGRAERPASRRPSSPGRTTKGRGRPKSARQQEQAERDKAPPPAGVAARKLAVEALVRIDEEGAYANLVLPKLLERSALDERDRHFATELVYGTTRMRRACDWLIDRFVMNELDAPTRALLRVGAYQLVFLGTPAHAGVSTMVDAAPRKVSGLVNAVLRRVAAADNTWPDEGTRLSYPAWIIDLLSADLGPDDAVAALEAMNHAASATERDDGYTQDLASQWVADAVPARAGDVVLDLCAAPGGKATRIAGTTKGAIVVAADVRPSRAGLIRHNVDRLALGDQIRIVTGDGTRPPFRAPSFAHVLVDAPCSGLGALRRRPDARWRIDPADVDALARIQTDLVDAAIELVRPGGTLTYSVCTLSDAETLGIDRHLEARWPGAIALPAVDGSAWDVHAQPHGRGCRLLPQAADTDGMYLLQLRR